MYYNTQLLDAAVNLRASNPLAWSAFLAGLDESLTSVLRGAMTVNREDLVLVQGQAKALAGLHKILREAPETLEKLKDKR